jgi:hypothetical protein
MMNTIRRLVLPAVVAALCCTVVGCNSRAFNQASQVVGEEAAYAALQSALTAAGVKSADHMTDAVRLAVDGKDYGGAAAAFAVALNEHNMKASQKLTSAQAVALMRMAIPAVGSGLSSFCDYLSSKG